MWCEKERAVKWAQDALHMDNTLSLLLHCQRIVSEEGWDFFAAYFRGMLAFCLLRPPYQLSQGLLLIILTCLFAQPRGF